MSFLAPLLSLLRSPAISKKYTPDLCLLDPSSFIPADKIHCFISGYVARSVCSLHILLSGPLRV